MIECPLTVSGDQLTSYVLFSATKYNNQMQNAKSVEFSDFPGTNVL